LAYIAQTLSCKAGIATLTVYQGENLFARSIEMRNIQDEEGVDLAGQHPCIAELCASLMHVVVGWLKSRRAPEIRRKNHQSQAKPFRLAAV